ncbi:universal stress protein [Ruegeria sp.]|uniref:universal stress protein n=1 Tax=Ruegeria sp. TaxID=1879320 RepID=UPI003B00D37A
MTKHILCAVDLTHPGSDGDLLAEAGGLAKFHGAALSVVTVIPDYGMSIVGSFFKEGTLKSAADTANEQLHALVKEVLPDTANVQHIVEIGSVYESILEAIELSKADLVVVGARKPTLADKLQGPNSSWIARNAPCSVYVVRP